LPYRPMTVRPKTNWRKRRPEKNMEVSLVPKIPNPKRRLPPNLRRATPNERVSSRRNTRHNHALRPARRKPKDQTNLHVLLRPPLPPIRFLRAGRSAWLCRVLRLLDTRSLGVARRRLGGRRRFGYQRTKLTSMFFSGLRFLQFVFGLTVIGLYGKDVHHDCMVVPGVAPAGYPLIGCCSA
jgi:hypothetical protein